jgi:uncharacterized protein YggE
MRKNLYLGTALLVMLVMSAGCAYSNDSGTQTNSDGTKGSTSGGITISQPSNVAYAANNSGNGRGEISVSGIGVINVNPDVAYISLGVSTKGIFPKAALEENNRSIAAVISAIREKGIAEKDIRTSDFNMYPDYQYDYDKNGEQTRGYTISNTIHVVVRDIATVGDVLGVAANAGANVSGGVQFGLLDNSAAYNEALVLAIKNAVGKVEAIAGALGQSIEALRR